MENLKTKIKKEAQKAAQLSKEAEIAFSVRNFVQGKVLMKQAVIAGKNCQNLIEQHNKFRELQSLSLDK